MPGVYFQKSSPPRITIEKSGGGASSRIPMSLWKTIIERFDLRDSQKKGVFLNVNGNFNYYK
tara:strand:+ start:337 stop:522 length:186 start_codon:yes stop_codon:yes gene_type:complete